MLADWEEGLDLIPQHMREGVRAHIQYGHPTGDFLTALFSNDFREIMLRADATNLAAIREWANYLYNYAPSACWGSRETVRLWRKAGGLAGHERTRAAECKEQK